MNKEQLDELVKRAAAKVYSPIFVAPIILFSIVSAIYLVTLLNLPPVLAVILVLIASYAITVVAFSTVIAIVMRIIQDDVVEEEDDDGLNAMPIVMTISSKSEPIGKFRDCEIFKWIDMTGEDGIITRFEFFGTIRHGEDMNWLPVGAVILEPGIIYATQQNETI